VCVAALVAAALLRTCENACVRSMVEALKGVRECVVVVVVGGGGGLTTLVVVVAAVVPAGVAAASHS
jgi:hypothetical protein